MRIQIVSTAKVVRWIDEVYEDKIGLRGEMLDVRDYVSYADFVEYMPYELQKYFMKDSTHFIYTDIYSRYFNIEGYHWFIVTEYTPVNQTFLYDPNRIQSLMEYTVRQWSDGIGESFEQKNINSWQYSMWHIYQPNPVALFVQ